MLILKKQIKISNDTFLFSFQPKNFEFSLLPGQHVRIINNGIKRMYTPISHTKDNIDLLVKVYLPTNTFSGGIMGNHLMNMNLNEEIQCEYPFGRMNIQDQQFYINNQKQKSFKNILCISGGSGITPIWSIIEEVKHYKNFKVLFCNKTEEDILMREQIEHWKHKLVLCIDQEKQGWTGQSGYISEDMLNNVFGEFDREESLVIYCGPKIMNENCNKFLENLGFVHRFKF